MRYFCVFVLLFSVVFPSLAQARGPMEIHQWMKTGGGSLTMNLLDYDDGQSNVIKGKLLPSIRGRVFFCSPIGPQSAV